MEGSGEFTWLDGKKYVGQYVDDKKEGYGVFTWPDNRQYNGYWKNGYHHGKGFYINSKSVLREGEWIEGKLIRWLDKTENKSEDKINL